VNTPNPRYDLFAKGIFVDPMVDAASLRETARTIRPRQSHFNLVRIGADHDGGYLVPSDLDGLVACFSPGVDCTASFETHLDALGIPSHLADASVESPPPGTPFKSFERKFLGSRTSGGFVSLEDWVDAKEPQAVEDSLILQMDIEGAEYETLLACPLGTLRKFRILVVEFHNIESWGQKEFFRIVNCVFDKLLDEFGVVHSHPNNATGIVNMNGFLAPRVFEVTFLRHTRSSFGAHAHLPNSLDRPNIPGRDDLTFPRDWLVD
jgi:hypothetical protein